MTTHAAPAEHWRVPTMVAFASMLLAGCGRGPNERAAEACHEAILERVSGKTIDVDRTAMARAYVDVGDGRGEISGPIVFDRGMPIEARQTFHCRVQFDAARPEVEPSVIGLQFIW